MQGSGDHSQLTQQTPHFRLHYLAGSFAEQHLALVSERFEQVYHILANLLGRDEAHARVIEVYLPEMVVGAQVMYWLLGTSVRKKPL